LKTSWFLGCWIQKLFGKVDAYFGASSWEEALAWLAGRPGTLTSIQYWGHGSPGKVWLAQALLSPEKLITILKPKVSPTSVLWWRTCSTFGGIGGHEISKKLADGLNCIVAGHTRIIGPVQGGLHTRKPQTQPSWPITEGEPPKSWWPSHLSWGPNSIFCLTTKIPDGW
jgi:hypothetical protein